MNECALTNELCAKLTAMGAQVYPLIGSTLAPVGWPDRYISHVRWRGFCEFKLLGAWLTDRQFERCCRLVENGDNVVVVVMREKSKGNVFTIHSVHLGSFDSCHGFMEVLCTV